MASAIQIGSFQVSFIWFQPVISLFNQVSTAPLGFVGRQEDYEKRFDQMVHHPSGESDLEPPWDTPETYRFWSYYIGTPGNITARNAWKGFLPFRIKVPFDINVETVGKEGCFLLEAFCYPHGLALIATARCDGEFSLDTMKEKAFQIRGQSVFEVKTMKGEDLGSITLQALVNDVMKWLYSQVMGSQAKNKNASLPENVSLQLNQSFSIFTILRGSVVDPDPEVSANKQLISIFEDVTRWDEHLIPIPWEKANLKIKNPKLGHVLYATKRGLAIWFPYDFMGDKEKNLSYYHQNQSFVALQVESLCGLISEWADMINANRQLDGDLENYVRRAIDTLGRLYGKAETGSKKVTYQTWSVVAQIEQNELKQIVDDVANKLGKPPLYKKEGTK
jgi:hypothetical protein